MKARYLVLLTAVLCSPPLYSQVSEAINPAPQSLSGTVLNSVTHEPIGRALVYSADERYATFTDDRGHFELNFSQPGQTGEVQVSSDTQVALQARRQGFLQSTGHQGQVLVRPGEKEVTLSLVPEGLIVGRVKFPSAEAGDSVQVRLYRREVRGGFAHWEAVTIAATRADGDFRFADLPAGEYKLFTLENLEQDPLVNAPNGPVYGFPPKYFAAARDLAAADTVRLHAGETFAANIAPERQRYYEVKVPVMIPEPADAGLAVSVYAQGHRGPGFALGFNRSEHAIMGSLPNGSYTIEAASSGPAAATGILNLTVSNGPAIGPLLTLARNPTIEINIQQYFSSADNAQAKSDYGDRSWPTAYVTLQSAEEFPGDRGRGIHYQSQGNPPTLSGVRPGPYWVQVEAGPGYAASVTSGGKDLQREPLMVPFGGSVPPIEMTVRYDGGEIEATIAGDPNGDLLARSGRTTDDLPAPNSHLRGGWYLYCLPLSNSGGPARGFNGWSNGSYVMQQVPPGDYLILAFDSRQELEYRDPAAMRAYESKGQVIHVAAGQKVRVRVQPITSE